MNHIKNLRNTLSTLAYTVCLISKVHTCITDTCTNLNN